MKQKEENKRSVNTISLFLTCLFLVWAVQFSDGGASFATKINKITENLDKAILGLDENVSYTNYTDKSVYFSSTKFNAAGMAGLYNLTNMFVDIVAPADILMPGLLTIDRNNGVIINDPQPTSLLKYYASLVAMVLFLVLCLIFFPLCGLCFCCCRCCGNCGATPQPSDKKKDTCKKIFQASLLIVCGTGLLFCIVCSFGSNQQMQEGIEQFPVNMNNSVRDTVTFMDSTNRQVNNLLGTNYGEFVEKFTNLMNNSSKIAWENLLTFTKASAVSDVVNFAESLDDIKKTLHALKVDTNKMRVYASQLNDAVRKVKRDLRATLDQCGSLECSALKEKIDRLQTSIDFDKVPDVSDTIKSLDNLAYYDISKTAKDVKENLDSISVQINTTLTENLSSAKKQIEDTKQVINSKLDDVTDILKQVKSHINNMATPLIDHSQDYIDRYSKYRYYVGVAISCALLLVAVCITCGLVCGICGKRPDGYSDNCCNKGAGGQFLICGVMFMFLFGFIISAVALVSLLVGVISEKAICDPLRNPDPNKFTIVKMIDDYDMDLGVKVELSTLLQNCYKNKSIYYTLNLSSKFNLTDLKEKFNVTAQLEGLNIDDAIKGGFNLLKDGQLESLEKLKEFKPDIDVQKYADELLVNMTTYNMNELARALESIIDSPVAPDLKTQLQLNLLHINTYEEKLIVPMKNLATNIVNKAKTLNDQLKMNKNSFKEAINDLIEEIKEADQQLNTNATLQLKETAQVFKSLVINLVDGFLDRLVDHVEFEVGKCGPLNLVVHASLTSTCEKVILPWNGFWFSLLWTIIIYIITIIIAVKLANLYQKHKPYDQYVETEYLYDAYADRGDNIPLNSRGGKRNKKKGKKARRYEERANVREVARDYVPGSHPPDGRYADMAPKQWEDFPNGGPPHYQRAPTEYERPPPYYYPGTGSGEQ